MSGVVDVLQFIGAALLILAGLGFGFLVFCLATSGGGWTGR